MMCEKFFTVILEWGKTTHIGIDVCV
jgi:hypothetical protein